MKRYPLVFGFRDLVAGEGFLAGVTTEGRALMEAEDDGAWVYGVNPGGVAAGGPDKGEAFAAFKKSYLSVLFDLAKTSATFEAFKSAVEAFFEETNGPAAGEWDEAVREVREGKITADWLGTRNADRELSVTVALVAKIQPSVNFLDEDPAVAA